MATLVKNYIILLFFLFSCCSILFAQNSDWIIYDTTNSGLPSNHITTISIGHNNFKWIGTAKGLVKFDGINWEIFNSSNSPLPSSFITSVLADDKGVWIGTDSGLIHVDDFNWKKFDEKDSIFYQSLIVDITKDKDENLWIAGEFNIIKIDKNSWDILDKIPGGTYHSIIVDNSNHLWYGEFDHLQFNGILWNYFQDNWTPYPLKNFPELTSSFPYSLSVDANNVIWLGTGGTSGGTLVKIENEKWTLFRSSNSGFNGSGILKILIEDSIKWLATGDGLVSFDNTNWKIFDKNNSEIPDDYITSLSLDNYGNKWIGTLAGGVAVYKNGGVTTSVLKNNNFPSDFILEQNYPNPFNSITKIKFSIPVLHENLPSKENSQEVSLKVYNILGAEVSKLVQEKKSPGIYEIFFDASGLPSGVYFYKLLAGNFISIKKMTYLK